MNTPPPAALLLLAPGCAHCPTVLASLSQLLEAGLLGTLEVVNIAAHPERAAQLGVRSVPWTRIGDFELEGLRSAAELRHWAAYADSDEGIREYASERLKAGALAQLERIVRQRPQWLQALLPLIGDLQAELHVRLGLGALLEAFAGSAPLRELVPALGELSRHPDHRVRSDACHYLALSGSAAAVPHLRARTGDDHPEVREIAADGLAALAAQP